MTRVSVSVADLSVFRNGHTLLNGVAFDVTSGEFLAIIGPNGAGKSTLLGVLAGDVSPSEGTAALLGEAVATLSLQQLALLRAFVGPQTASDVVFPVGDVVAMGRHPYGDEAAAATQGLVDSAMSRLDVGDFAHRELRTLSSGEQQRVAIARAVVQETEILLLDEPTSALDLKHQELVMALLQELCRDGTSVVAVLHDLNLAAAYADRVVLMAGGRIEAHGSPWDVLTGERLSAAYQQSIEVIRHPFRDCPLVLVAER
ncbi:MAG: heme ABC transporter ATP-binding protein [Acidimicrobiia bacterium]|nr:heme ABC transporter ATP-binding protein [Acidimicrobiia bacterium]